MSEHVEVLKVMRDELPLADGESSALDAAIAALSAPAEAQPVAYSRAPVDGRLNPITPREYAWLREAGGGEGFRPLVYGDTAQPTAEAQPDWYCAHCQRGVDMREVTYSEQHEVCGRYIANDDLPPSAPVGMKGLVSNAIAQGKRLQWSAVMVTLERLHGALTLAQQPAARKPRATRDSPHFTNHGDSEAEFIAHEAIACTACGGSGHAEDQQPAVVDEAAVRWAVERWNDEVANRPLVNVHRRTLDITWRQVIRHFGGDDVTLCGPRHDDLPAQQGGES